MAITREQAIAKAKLISVEFRNLVKTLHIKAKVKTKPMARGVVVAIDVIGADDKSLAALYDLRNRNKHFWLNINIYNWNA